MAFWNGYIGGNMKKEGKKMKRFNDVDCVWDYLIEAGLFTEGELTLVTCINGYRIEVLNDCLFARYGYRDLEQMLGAEK